MKADVVLVRRVPAPIGAPYKDALVPHDDRAAELMAKIPLGEDVAIKIMRGRSLAQHRMFFGLLTRVAEATEWETPERLLVALKVRLGRYDVCKLPNGKLVPVPHSISFAAMSADDFAKFLDDSVRVIAEEVLPGTDPLQLLAEAQGAA